MPQSPFLPACVLAALVLLAPVSGLAGAPSPSGEIQLAAVTETLGTKPRNVEIQVTSDGFVPAVVNVKHGEKVNLVVTRKTDRTCATALVMREKGINVDLPLDKPVSIPFQADKVGEVDYACPMDMVKGKIVVEK